jgi:hypothetical protein
MFFECTAIGINAQQRKRSLSWIYINKKTVYSAPNNRFLYFFINQDVY